MPNWVCNHLTIHGENSVEVMRSLLTKNEDNYCGYDFDLNKIRPMPDELNIVSGTITTNCARLYVNAILQETNAFMKYAGLFAQAFQRDFYLTESEQMQLMSDALEYKNYPSKELFFKTKADVYAYGKRALDNYAQYGAKDWYDWCRYNWGTKWNACDTQIIDLNTADIYFNTAWSPISDLIGELAKQYPECCFDYQYAEEQAGVYAGYRNYENGEEVSGEDYPEFSKEAYEMFFSMWGMEDEFEFNEEKGTYEYIDTEEVM